MNSIDTHNEKKKVIAYHHHHYIGDIMYYTLRYCFFPIKGKKIVRNDDFAY
jgi:hypothetical protein